MLCFQPKMRNGSFGEKAASRNPKGQVPRGVEEARQPQPERGQDGQGGGGLEAWVKSQDPGRFSPAWLLKYCLVQLLSFCKWEG